MEAPTPAEETPDIPWAFLDPEFIPPHISNPNDEETVPLYTETDTNSLTTFLDSLPSLTTRLQLPLTRYPSPYLTILDAKQARRRRQSVHPSFLPRGYHHPPSRKSKSAPEEDESTLDVNPLAHDASLSDSEKSALLTVQSQIIASLFAAIKSKNTEAVTLLVQRGFVSPDIPEVYNYYLPARPGGRTPLIAAVEAGNGQMVCTLLGLGAQVDAFGLVGGRERTALMVAAARGNLALVKLLREEFGADDGVIAADGQMALRLAAEGGHRDVVEYLPARRGGAWKRWMVANDAAIWRVRTAVGKIVRFFEILLWEVPRFLVWDVPKHVVVRPVARMGKYCWEHKREFGGWCKRQAKELPGRVKRAGKAVWKTAKKVPKKTWEVVKATPGVVWKLIKWIWQVIQRVPKAMMTLAAWIWESLKRVGKAVGHVFLRIVAVLHTAVSAVLDFFRGITLKDVWIGVCDVFKAVFKGVSRAIWSVVSGTVVVIAGVVIGLLGITGKLIVWLAEALWYVIKYVPRQLGEMMSGIWSSIAKGYHEIMVLFNPKH